MLTLPSGAELSRARVPERLLRPSVRPSGAVMAANRSRTAAALSAWNRTEHTVGAEDAALNVTINWTNGEIGEVVLHPVPTSLPASLGTVTDACVPSVGSPRDGLCCSSMNPCGD